MRNRAVFLDRDGVINDVTMRNGRAYPPRSLEEWTLVPRAAETLQRLQQDGFRLIVVTNQPDVARGVLQRDMVEAIHARMRALLPLDDVKVCYHLDQDGCGCRKPKPGMLLEAARQWHVDLTHSFMVGDRWRDIEAGKAAGCRTIWIQRGYAEQDADRPDAVVSSLQEAGELIHSWRV